MNSPVNFNDPTGRIIERSLYAGDADFGFSQMYGIKFTGDFSKNGWGNYQNMRAAMEAVKVVGGKLAEVLAGTSSSTAFKDIYKDGVNFEWVSSYTGDDGQEHRTGAITKNDHWIQIASLPQPNGGNRTTEMAFTSARNNIGHELGHAFASLWWIDSNNYDQSGPYGNQHSIPGSQLNNDGFYLYPEPTSAKNTWRQHPCVNGDYACPNETFADMFLGWTYGKWADNKSGIWRNDYMTTNMAEWVPAATER